MATEDDTGATPKELLIESCRRNNSSLLTTLLASPPLSSQPGSIAQFLNTTTDALGCSALHIASQYGAYDVLDLLLDQEGVEIDGREKREGDTALHKAVRFANEEGKAGGQGLGEGGRCVEILVDAGCDPRIRNHGKLRPVDLVEPGNRELRMVLQKAEMAMVAGDDVVEEEEEEEGREGAGSESD